MPKCEIIDTENTRLSAKKVWSVAYVSKSYTKHKSMSSIFMFKSFEMSLCGRGKSG